jgi:hypothetical protein
MSSNQKFPSQRRLSAALVALFAMTLPLSAEAPRESVQSTTTQRLDFAPGGTISFDNSSGYISIEGWDQPQVEVTIVKSMQHYYKPQEKDQAARQLDQIQVTSDRRSDGELVILTKIPSRGFFTNLFHGKIRSEIEYRIRAPREAKLVIRHRGGYVLVRDMSGDIDATSRTGDIVLMLPDPGAYSIDAKTKLGGVVSDFSGADARDHLVGERFSSNIPPPSHRLFLRVGLGGITIKGVPDKPLAPLAAAAQ